MKNGQRGEIATIITLGTLLILGASTLVSSFVLNSNKKQTTKTKAAESCFNLSADFSVQDAGDKKAFYARVSFDSQRGGKINLSYNGIGVAGPNDFSGGRYTYGPQWTQPYGHDSDVAVMTVGEGDYPFTYTGWMDSCQPQAQVLSCTLGVKDGQAYVSGSGCTLNGQTSAPPASSSQTSPDTSNNSSDSNSCGTGWYCLGECADNDVVASFTGSYGADGKKNWMMEKARNEGKDPNTCLVQSPVSRAKSALDKLASFFSGGAKEGDTCRYPQQEGDEVKCYEGNYNEKGECKYILGKSTGKEISCEREYKSQSSSSSSISAPEAPADPEAQQPARPAAQYPAPGQSVSGCSKYPCLKSGLSYYKYANDPNSLLYNEANCEKQMPPGEIASCFSTQALPKEGPTNCYEEKYPCSKNDNYYYFKGSSFYTDPECNKKINPLDLPEYCGDNSSQPVPSSQCYDKSCSIDNTNLKYSYKEVNGITNYYKNTGCTNSLRVKSYINIEEYCQGSLNPAKPSDPVKSNKCTEGEQVCTSGNAYNECGANGEWLNYTCPTDQICQNNSSKKNLCVPANNPNDFANSVKDTKGEISVFVPFADGGEYYQYFTQEEMTRYLLTYTPSIQQEDCWWNCSRGIDINKSKVDNTGVTYVFTKLDRYKDVNTSSSSTLTPINYKLTLKPLAQQVFNESGIHFTGFYQDKMELRGGQVYLSKILNIVRVKFIKGDNANYFDWAEIKINSQSNIKYKKDNGQFVPAVAGSSFNINKELVLLINRMSNVSPSSFGFIINYGCKNDNYSKNIKTTISGKLDYTEVDLDPVTLVCQ